MKKLLLLFGFLTLLFALPATAQKGEKSYTIEFATSTSGTNSMNASAIMDAITEEGRTFVESISDAKYIFPGGTDGLRFGNSSNKGEFTINLTAAGKVKAKRIVVNAKQYESDANCKVSGPFSATNSQALEKDFNDFVFTNSNYILNPAIESIRLTVTTKRGYIKSVTVIYDAEEGGDGGETPVDPVDPVDPDPTPSDTPQTLFHETFGDNGDKARDWSDEYSVKSGVESVYKDIKYTITNAKQSKNSVGKEKSGLAQSSEKTPALFIAGPFHLSSTKDVKISYHWKAASIKGTYTAKIFYSTDEGINYTEIEHSFKPTTASAFVEVKVSLPNEALVNNTYIKIELNTNVKGAQAVIDEFDIAGVLVTPSTTEIAYDDIAKIADLENGAEVKITDAYVVEIDGEKSVVVYDKSNGNISAIYAIVLDENAEHSFVANRIHNVIGTVAKDGETISIVDAVIADSNDPMLAIDTMPAISFEENGEPTQGGAQYIHKPVTISHAFHAAGNATIYYTRDGSTPNIKNAREENAAASARSRAEGEEEEAPVADPTLDKGTFVYSGPFYAIHPNNWQNITHGNRLDIKAVVVPTMAGAHLWNASDVAEMSQGITTGITDINAADADATYYTIQGIRVDAPSAGNIYIRVANGQASKVRF